MVHLLSRESLKNPGGEKERLESESVSDDQILRILRVLRALRRAHAARSPGCCTQAMNLGTRQEKESKASRHISDILTEAPCKNKNKTAVTVRHI